MRSRNKHKGRCSESNRAWKRRRAIGECFCQCKRSEGIFEGTGWRILIQYIMFINTSYHNEFMVQIERRVLSYPQLGRTETTLTIFGGGALGGKVKGVFDNAKPIVD